MIERPIIFSDPMVRAILESRKTQTRRMPTSMWDKLYGHIAAGGKAQLWVQETWAYRLDHDHMNAGQLYAAGVRQAWYWADGPARTCRTGCAGAAGRVRAARFMPRWASRITLDVTAMRKERLQDGVSFREAIAEGIQDPCGQLSTICCLELVNEFVALWDSLHRKLGTRWADNPEVYVIGFRRTSASDALPSTDVLAISGERR